MKALNIAIVVHGRFYAFDLARALGHKGHSVTVLTNSPKWKDYTKSSNGRIQFRCFGAHGLLSRFFALTHLAQARVIEAALHRLFSNWAADQIKGQDFDGVFIFSGVAEEILKRVPGKNYLVRASAHIASQWDLLNEEQQRMGVKINKPSEWMLRREIREYELAPRIVVLSTFAKESFIQRGVSRKKLKCIGLGYEVSPDHIKKSAETRFRRISRGEKLRILTVGTLSGQKGVYDYLKIIKEAGNNFDFKFVGTVLPEARELLKREGDLSQLTLNERVHEERLGEFYAWGDVFLYPTIQDGFAIVLAQALCFGLAVLTTEHSAGRDLISSESAGAVFEIRNPEAFIQQLRWYDGHRDETVKMLELSMSRSQVNSWDQIAQKYEDLLKEVA